MSADDNRRAIGRFVAGLPVEADALATAITAKAVDRTVVIEALLKGLASPERVVRRRAAQRVARMPDVAPRVAARLALLAGTDDDDRSREASAAALRVHDLPVPGEAPTGELGSARASLAGVLRLKALVTRAPDAPITLVARYREDGPDLLGQLKDEESEVRLELSGLPQAFAGTRPVLRTRREAGSGPLAQIAWAETPVSTGGDVTISVPLEGASVDDLVDWLANGVDLVIPDV